MTRDASPDHPIHELIRDRWSPYAFDPKEVSADDLRSLFEAASWAASSFNEQPWRYIVASRSDSEAFEAAIGCLIEANQTWAKHASVIAFGITKDHFTHNDKENRVALHDLGAASASLTLEATHRGLVVHQMGGIDPDKVRETYGVPEGHTPQTGLAIGYQADLEDNPLPDELKQRDRGERTRKPLAQFVFGGRFGDAASIAE